MMWRGILPLGGKEASRTGQEGKSGCPRREGGPAQEHRRQWREECVCVCVCVYVCVCVTGALKCSGETLGRQTPAAPPTCQFLTPADPKRVAQ